MNLGTTLLVALAFSIPTGASQGMPSTTVTSVRLEVLGTPACITHGELASRVEARSSRIRFVDESALVARVSVEIPQPGTVVAELVIASSGGQRPPRRVVVRSCAEAVDAMALIITVTLDPTLAKRPATGIMRDKVTVRDSAVASSPAPDAVAAKSAPPEAQGASSPQPIAKPADAPQVIEEPAPVVRREADEPSAPSSPATATRRFGVFAAAQSIVGPAPALMPGFALYGLAGLDRDSLWSPAIQVGLTRVWRSDLPEPGGKASFTLDAASLDVCALRLRWTSLEARVCGAALVGRMIASGAAYTDVPGTSTRPFAVAGGALLVTAGLGAMIELSARFGVGATLIRDAYDFAPPAFHRARPVTTSASLAVGVRWP